MPYARLILETDSKVAHSGVFRINEVLPKGWTFLVPCDGLQKGYDTEGEPGSMEGNVYQVNSVKRVRDQDYTHEIVLVHYTGELEEE